MASSSVSIASSSPGFDSGTPSTISGAVYGSASGSTTATATVTASGAVPGAGSSVAADPALGPPGSAGHRAVQKAVADANAALAQGGTELNFVFDKQVNDMIVKVVDRQTHQVVQQIPAKWMTAAARALASAQPGALINTNA